MELVCGVWWCLGKCGVRGCVSVCFSEGSCDSVVYAFELLV